MAPQDTTAALGQFAPVPVPTLSRSSASCILRKALAWYAPPISSIALSIAASSPACQAHGGGARPMGTTASPARPPHRLPPRRSAPLRLARRHHAREPAHPAVDGLRHGHPSP